jgi:hypothetical protein
MINGLRFENSLMTWKERVLPIKISKKELPKIMEREEQE